MTDENPKEEQPIAETPASEPEQPVLEGAVATATETEPTDEKEPVKLKQEVEIKEVGPCKKHIKVMIDRENIDKMMNEKFSELVSEAPVAGFRPGKAPRRLIEKQFHKQVANEVRGQVLMQSLEQLSEDFDVAPLSAPNINPDSLDIPKEGPFIYEFEVEVRPDFELPEYKGIKIKRPVKTFTDQDVEVEERRVLSRWGSLVPKPDGAAEIGDYLIADMTTRDGDQVLGTLKEISIQIDPRLALKDGVAPRFGEQVKGVQAGESRTVDIRLSDSAAVAELRGKTVKATLDVKEVKSMRLPELTDDFLAGFGIRTPEQLREQIRVILDRRLEYQQRQSARQQFLQKITEASKWDLPRDLLQRQARSALNKRIVEMRSAGMSEDEIRGRIRLMEQDVMQSTALTLAEHFVLQKIAEVEKLDVDQDDIDIEIERIAIQSDESPRRVRARFEREDLLESLATEIVERKALDLILQNAEYEDVPLEPDEGAVATAEQQAVPGAMHDATAPPPDPEVAKEESGETPSETKS